jgi:hypothetical protein
VRLDSPAVTDHFPRSAMSLSGAFRSAPKGTWSDAPAEFIVEDDTGAGSAGRLDFRCDRCGQPAIRRRLSAGSDAASNICVDGLISVNS